MKNLTKNDLRKLIQNKLNKLSTNEWNLTESTLHTHLFNSSLWKKANIIGITYSTNIEWNTKPIMQRAWLENKTICIPKTDAVHKEMAFYKIQSLHEVSIGYANIMEPKEIKERFIHKQLIDLLIVPGVVFDLFGYRIGYGGGYYDRFLTDFANNTVSIVSNIQIIDKLKYEGHDIAVKYLITEDGCQKTREG